VLKSALRYLKIGWNVIPVNRDKKPYLSSWEQYQQRRVTEEEVRQWWTKWPDANIAVLTGQLSGIVVIDIDEKSSLQYIEPHLNKKTTLTCITGRGGKHLYFRHPGITVPNAVRFLPGVDCRGDGGYVVVPPSIHRSYRRYRWENSNNKLAELPQTLLSLILDKSRKKKLSSKDWKADIPEGNRDVELTRRAGRLLQIGIPAGEVLTILKTLNQAHCKPPLPEAQVEKIVESIASRETRRKEERIKSKQENDSSPFTVLTQQEMLERYGGGEDEIRWTIAEWLPEASCGLIVAPPGSHKTWILLNLALAVSTGRPFLGHYPVNRRGPVLFIQQEDPWPMLLNRLGRMLNSLEPMEEADGEDITYTLDCRFIEEFHSMPIFWYTDRQLNFADEDIMIKLEQKIAELKPRLVVIDPLYTAADTREYMAGGAQKMVALKKMRDNYKCSFIIAHHTKKSSEEAGNRTELWGSQFLNAWLEFGWQIRKSEDENTERISRHFKNAEAPEKLQLVFKITNWTFEVNINSVDTSEDSKPSKSSVTSIIEKAILLEGKRFNSVREMAELAKCSKSTAHDVIKKLKLEKNEDGYYQLPDK